MKYEIVSGSGEVVNRVAIDSDLDEITPTTEGVPWRPEVGFIARKMGPPPTPEPPSLASVKASLLPRVDMDAEGVRLRMITPGTGKAMSYQEKLAEARLVLDDPQAIDVALVPILAAEATARGITVEQAATLVHQTYLAFKTIEAQINATTITGKAAISAASDAPAAQAAYEAITWPSIP